MRFQVTDFIELSKDEEFFVEKQIFDSGYTVLFGINDFSKARRNYGEEAVEEMRSFGHEDMSADLDVFTRCRRYLRRRLYSAVVVYVAGVEYRRCVFKHDVIEICTERILFTPEHVRHMIDTHSTIEVELVK